MMGIVQRRADQVVHAGVDDQEVLGIAALHIDHAADQHPGIGGDQPPRLEGKRAAEIPGHPRDHRAVGGGVRWRLVVVLVRHAQPAAQVQARDGMAVRAQGGDQFAHPDKGGLEWLEVGDLAADMHIDAHDLDTRKAGGMGVSLAGMDKGDAELGLGRAGGDLGVGFGIHIRVDAQGDGRALAHRQRQCIQRIQLGLAFDVELVDAGGKRRAHLLPGLAHAGEDDPVRRYPGGQRLGQLAARHHISAGAKPGQRPQHCQVAVGLDGKGDQRAFRHRAGEHLVVPLQRGGGIAVKGRADLFGQQGQRHVFGAQDAIAIFEMMHEIRTGSLSPCFDRPGMRSSI